MKENDIKFNRRNFLKNSTGFLAGMSAYSIVPNFAFEKITELETLGALFFEVFPHTNVPKKYYTATAQGLLDKAAGDPELKKMIDDGIQQADTMFPRPFIELGYEHKDQVMEKLRPTKFYDSLRGHAVVAFYNTKEVWKYFGYPGSSYEFGGYLENVGDISWIE